MRALKCFKINIVKCENRHFKENTRDKSEGYSVQERGFFFKELLSQMVIELYWQKEIVKM